MAEVFAVFGKSGKPIPYNPATAKDPSMLATLVEASLS